MGEIVIIPVYEPEPVLLKLVEEVREYGNFVIVVDDGSSQQQQQVFWELAESAVVLHHERNKGKGAAIKTALAYIRENHLSDEVIGVMDGDGQHLPSDMEKVLLRAGEEKNSLILGVRQVGRKMPFRS